MDGAFLELDAEMIDGEVDEYHRELYKIQKIFNTKLKRMQAEKAERDREWKKKHRHRAEEDGEDEEQPEPDLVPPAALTICNTVQDQMKDFKASGAQLRGPLH